MKTCDTTYTLNGRTKNRAGRQLLTYVLNNIREILALSGGIMVASGIVILSIWVSGLDSLGIIGAATWGSALIFLGLAVDNREPTALLQLVSGIVLIILALLQNTVSPDFLIGTGVLIASWIAVLTYRQLR